jgi:hypothetical protein
MRKTDKIKRMNDTRMVYLIACGVLDKKRISEALDGDAKYNTYVGLGIFDKKRISKAENELERGDQVDG